MPHIPMIDYDTAPQHIRAAHDAEVEARGRMTNMKRTLLHSPEAHRIYAEWFTLRAELNGVLDDRAVQVFCKAISEEAGSRIASPSSAGQSSCRAPTPMRWNCGRRMSFSMRLAGR